MVVGLYATCLSDIRFDLGIAKTKKAAFRRPLRNPKEPGPKYHFGPNS